MNSETLDIIGQYYSAETRLSKRLGFDDIVRVKKWFVRVGILEAEAFLSKVNTVNHFMLCILYTTPEVTSTQFYIIQTFMSLRNA